MRSAAAQKGCRNGRLAADHVDAPGASSAQQGAVLAGSSQVLAGSSQDLVGSSQAEWDEIHSEVVREIHAAVASSSGGGLGVGLGAALYAHGGDAMQLPREP